MECRACRSDNTYKFLDLGEQPLANNFLDTPDAYEDVYPLDVYMCEKCGLVQLGTVVDPRKIFNKDYIYYTSNSHPVAKHLAHLCLKLYNTFIKEKYPSFILEIGSNDGSALSVFKILGCKVLGIDPAGEIARVADVAGIPTWPMFYDKSCAELLDNNKPKANLILARHVVAHVPDLFELFSSFKMNLAQDGVLVIEAPYLSDLIAKNEFDTIYHEHYYYLSLKSISYLARQQGLEVFNVEKYDIHGGSVVYYIGFEGKHKISSDLHTVMSSEILWELDEPKTYDNFRERVEFNKKDILEFVLRETYKLKRSLVCYGASAKSSTLLNYYNWPDEVTQQIVDCSPNKLGKYTPGKHLKVIKELPEDVNLAFLTAWNFRKEILAKEKSFKGAWIIPIPYLEVIYEAR
jgi:C-methyltransferase C-terminal domain/Putative zinc binding domain/Methyltransferase domain